jgi:ADP-heptose:LPS heptosyltransferase
MLGHTPEDIPDIGPYITADPSLVATWRERLANYDGRKIGISWRGSPKHPADRMRSIPLAEFAPLAQLPGVQLFSLQKGAGAEELASMAERYNIIDLGSGLDENTGAFVETAAVLKNLDLVIACDTAIVHVAGALGVPTWVALNNSPDWRWLQNGNRTNAYPNTRLFRQPTFGDWKSVVATMTSELRSGPLFLNPSPKPPHN